MQNCVERGERVSACLTSQMSQRYDDLTIHSPQPAVTYQSEALNDLIKHMEGYLNIYIFQAIAAPYHRNCINSHGQGSITIAHTLQMPDRATFKFDTF